MKTDSTKTDSGVHAPEYSESVRDCPGFEEAVRVYSFYAQTVRSGEPEKAIDEITSTIMMDNEENLMESIRRYASKAARQPAHRRMLAATFFGPRHRYLPCRYPEMYEESKQTLTYISGSNLGTQA